MQNGAVRTHARSHENITTVRGLTGYPHARSQCVVCFFRRPAGRGKPRTGHLITRRNDDTRTRIDIGLVDRADFIRVIGEDAR